MSFGGVVQRALTCFRAPLMLLVPQLSCSLHNPNSLPPAPSLRQLPAPSETLCFVSDTLPFLLLVCSCSPSHLLAALGFKCLMDTLPWMPLSPSVTGV